MLTFFGNVNNPLLQTVHWHNVIVIVTGVCPELKAGSVEVRSCNVSWLRMSFVDFFSMVYGS
jgi:hypothetical protein